MNAYKIGMFGAGHIARDIAMALDGLGGCIIKYAVASRNYESAKKFQEEFGFEKYYDNYGELLADANIDFIYISTPTGCHYDNIKSCLIAGKHVICEKSFVENEIQAKELFKIAYEKKLILLDAIWTMYMPMYEAIDKIVKNGYIGEIRWLFASFGYPGLNNKRLMNSSGGGALLDKGIYCISMANKYFSEEPISIISKNKYKDEIDIDNKIKMKYRCGTVKVHSSIFHRTTYLLLIKAQRGIIISRKFWEGKKFILLQFPFKIKQYKFQHAINGYEHELMEMLKLMDAKQFESSKLTHEMSIKNMRIMDEARN